jgi:hypothetical protein
MTTFAHLNIQPSNSAQPPESSSTAQPTQLSPTASPSRSQEPSRPHIDNAAPLAEPARQSGAPLQGDTPDHQANAGNRVAELEARVALLQAALDASPQRSQEPRGSREFLFTMDESTSHAADKVSPVVLPAIVPGFKADALDLRKCQFASRLFGWRLCAFRFLYSVISVLLLSLFLS